MKSKKFRRDPVHEMVLRMQREQPLEYRYLSDKTKQAAAIYERLKKEAQADDEEEKPQAA